MRKTIQTSFIILILLYGAYYLLRESLTTYYHRSYQHKLEIIVSTTQNLGIGQDSGYDIVFAFENKKTSASASFETACDHFWYELFVENITIEKQKIKTIVIHNLKYGHYVFIDYHTLKQRCKDFYDFNGGMILDSTDLILQELKNARPIWTLGNDW